MTITIASGGRQAFSGTFGDVQLLNNTTATARQFISAAHPVTEIGGTTTATGNALNLYTVYGTGTSTATSGPPIGPAVEGMEKAIFLTASAEAKVVFQSMATGRVAGLPEMNGTGTATQVGIYVAASATGAFMLSLPGHYIRAKFMNSQWHVIGGNASYATAT